MREILFRGKRVDNGEWVEGGFVHQTDFYGMEIDEYRIIDGTETEDNNIGFSYEVIPETVGQYFLTDKNGKKIFEGDFVRYVEVDIDGSEDIHTGIIFYDLAKAGYEIARDDYKVLFANLFIVNIEVIGNIYDNPELLGGNENG